MSDIYNISHGEDMLHSYCFIVTFNLDSYYEIGFSKISSIQDEAECETIIEGNGKIHLVPKYTSKPKVVTFSKGVSSKSNDILSKLCVGKYISDITISIGSIKGKDFSYFANDSITPRKYILTDCIITKYNISNIDALTSQVLWENFEVSYTNKIRF